MAETHCYLCRRLDGEHARDCPNLQALLDIQLLQKLNRERKCSHIYPRYRDGRCMGCAELPDTPTPR